MSFYSELAENAQELLTEFGQPVTLTRATPGSYDPSTGATASATSETYTVHACVFGYAQRDIDGQTVRVGDQVAYLPTIGAVLPRTGDTLTVGGTVFSVVAGRQINPAGTAVLFEAQLRGVAP